MTSEAKDTRIPVGARLDRLPVAGFHVTILVIASLSLLFDTLDTVMTGFVLAVIRPEWGFSVAAIGIISAIGTAGYWLGAISCGFIGDRFGRKRVILYTLIAYSVFSFSRGFTNELVLFGILNFLTWVFVGAESSIVPVYLAEIAPARLRARLSGWMMMFFALGLAAAPLWTWLIIPHLGWQWAFFLTAPFAILVGIMRQKLPESPRWLERVGQTQTADQEVAKIERKVLGDRPPPPVDPRYSEIANSQPPASVRDLLTPQFRARTIALWCAWFAQYGVLYSFLTFAPTLLALDGVTITKPLAYSVVIYSAFVPGYVGGGYLAERMDRKWLIVMAFTLTGIFGTLFGLSTKPALVMIFGACLAISAGLGATGVYTYTPELYPTEIRATGMGIASSWGRIGSIALLLTFGIFAVLQGKLTLFLIADVILLIAAIVVAVLGPPTGNRPLDESSLSNDARARVQRLKGAQAL